MWARYVSVKARIDLVELYNATAVGEELRPSWNVAPTNQVYAVIDHKEPTGDKIEREVRPVQWGLVPSWADSPKIGSKLISARVESLASEPSLPAAGYYEWAPGPQVQVLPSGVVAIWQLVDRHTHVAVVRRGSECLNRTPARVDVHTHAARHELARGMDEPGGLLTHRTSR